MSEAQRWTVKCQDPADGSGDVMFDLPPEPLASLGLNICDVLTIEVIDGAIVLTTHRSQFSSSKIDRKHASTLTVCVYSFG